MSTQETCVAPRPSLPESAPPGTTRPPPLLLLSCPGWEGWRGRKVGEAGRATPLEGWPERCGGAGARWAAPARGKRVGGGSDEVSRRPGYLMCSHATLRGRELRPWGLVWSTPLPCTQSRRGAGSNQQGAVSPEGHCCGLGVRCVTSEPPRGESSRRGPRPGYLQPWRRGSSSRGMMSPPSGRLS